VRGVHPAEEGFSRFVLTLDPIFSSGDEFIIAGLHPFRGEGAGVFDFLFPHLAPTRLLRRVVFLRGPTVQNTARTEFLAESWVLRVIDVLRLFFAIEVIQVAEKLIEAMNGWQILVEITKMILTELASRIAERLRSSAMVGSSA